MSSIVLEAQQWLNSTYKNQVGYIPVEENGMPGTALSSALVSALQIELGLTTVTGIFGDQTYSQCDARPLSSGDANNRVRILQYALQGKGYNSGTCDGRFSMATQNALLEIQDDAGLDSSQSSTTATGRQMKAACGVDEYKLIAGGDARVRYIQRTLNHLYLEYTDICAADGVVGRSTSKAFIYALQAEEGLPVGTANGTFGPTTRTWCPDLNTGTQQYGYGNKPYSSAQMTRFTELAQYTLYCNGIDRYRGSAINRYTPGQFTGSFSDEMLSALHTFQSDYALPIRNILGLDEWMALLVSTGNQQRNGTSCDCATQLSTAKVTALRNDGYSIVGRYLTGAAGSGASRHDKFLTREEMERIISEGMRYFCIFQDDTDWWQTHEDLSDYFSYSRGFSDARKALLAAMDVGIPMGSTIYFAVDYDYMEGEVFNKVVPHFSGINNFIKSYGSPYAIGIYSARNTCGIIMAQDLAANSFIADMSTGYSGNLGYPLPENWAFDQILEYTLGASDGSFGVDKGIEKGRDAGQSRYTPYYVQPQKDSLVGALQIVDTIPHVEELENCYVEYFQSANQRTPTQSELALGTTNYLRAPRYGSIAWAISLLAPINQGFIAFMKLNHASLHDYFQSILGETSPLFTDPALVGRIDYCHLMAVVEGYAPTGVVPNFWTGWGGDLATGFASAYTSLGNPSDMGAFQNAADTVIGAVQGSSACNCPDLYTDADAISISSLALSDQADSMHPISSALASYYGDAELYLKRFSTLLSDMNAGDTLDELTLGLYAKMHGNLESAPGGLLSQFDGQSPDALHLACCRALANYLLVELE